jgi:hypothetical protein
MHGGWREILEDHVYLTHRYDRRSLAWRADWRALRRSALRIRF